MKSVSAPHYVIDLKDVSKEFRRSQHGKGGYGTIKAMVLNLFRGRSGQKQPTTRALDDVTLRIPKGASVGIIGRNGSGKSTLLKLITGIYKPSSGSIRVEGRVAALIELGAGFHPDFTGRENLFLGGVMHGLTKRQIEERFDHIVDFAELREVIDEPVRTYSSGMFMRLGFSLAVHTDPDVLLIDEVLAVGDAAFVSKCKDRISELREKGVTLLLVTHDLAAVERWSDEVLWLHEGIAKDRGSPRRVIDAYRQFLEAGEEEQIEEENEARAHELEEVPYTDQEEAQAERWGSREIELTAVRLRGKTSDEHYVFHPDEDLCIEIDYVVHQPQDSVVFGIGIERADGLMIHGSNTDLEKVQVPELGAAGQVRYSIARLGLLDGRYRLDVAIHREDGYPYDYRKSALHFVVRDAGNHVGIILPEHSWEFDARSDLELAAGNTLKSVG